MSQKWTLVTGANGFIGSTLVRQLVERGQHVKAFVRAESNIKALEGLPEDRCKIAVGDVRIPNTVYAALNGCDRMYHVAATYSLNERKKKSILDDSILGMQSICEVTRQAGLEKVVVTSSAAALGATNEPTPMTEDHDYTLEDAATYVEAKANAQAVALDAVEKQGLPIVVVQPTATVGPGDWKPTPTGQLLIAYLELSPSFRVPVTPGGFSYVDVEDVANGHILAMEKGKVGECYLLGGENLDQRQFYEMMSDITGLAEPGKDQGEGGAKLFAWLMELVASWKGTDPLVTRKAVSTYFGRYVFADSSKAKNELGYEYRPARESLSRSVRWFLDHGYVRPQAARRVRLELRPV